MTREEKQLLFKDICARLPYFPMVHWRNADVILTPVMLGLYFNEECRPYLRPMSSMTREERLFLLKFGTVGMDENDKVFDVYPYGMERTMPVIDFLNAYHFDYRGLIPMGLALEAPEGMYKTE